ncbi:MAG TPA: DUF4339 domain-containing protein [Candidatus Limnocylindria bacterium]|jgi:hypothetical protein|nr:DUF4339 domain-containing protein [Candidatus Limnocylindria bacterium]
MEPTAWFYAVQGQQHGPVSVEELRRLVEQGVVRNETLVWQVGMPSWQPFATVRQVVFPLEPASVPQGEAGNPREGAPPLPVNPIPTPNERRWATLEEVAARDYEFDYGARISEAFEVLTKPNWTTFWAVLVGFLCILATGLVPFSFGLVTLLTKGPLLGGIYLTALKKRRTGTVAVGDVFQGFGARFGVLIGAHILSGLVAFIPFLFGLSVMAANLAARGFFHGPPPNDPAEILLLLIPGIAALIISGLVSFVLYSLVQWTVPLVADKGLGPVEALGLGWRVARKHWFSHVLLLLLAKLIEFAGTLAFCLGLAFAVPLNATIYAVQYEKLFGDLEPRAKRV